MSRPRHSPPARPSPRPRATAFPELYRRHFAFVWRLAYRLGVDAAELEDVAQEVFIVVCRQLATFEHRSRVETWLAAITRRVVWRYRRGRDRARRKLDALEVSASPDDGFSLERGMAIARLDRFVRGLPRGQREVFVLSELEGWKGPEIVAATGMNLNTVYARIRTTRQRFETWCIEQAGPGDAPAMQILEQGRHRPQPSREAASRVWALLGARLGPLGPASESGPASEPGPMSEPGPVTSLATNLQTFAVTIVLGGVGLLAARAALPPATGPTPTNTVVSSGAVPASSREAAGKGSPEAGSPAAGSPAAVVDAAVSAPSTGSPSAVASARADAAAAAPSTAPARPPSRGVDPTKASSPTEPAHPTLAPAHALARERALIATARTTIDRSPQQALAQLDAHEREFPDGVLGRERARLRVRALCRLGRWEDAQRVARRVPDPSLLARECPRDPG